MENQKITVTYRKMAGKGPARRLRAHGLAPAVIYGRSVQDSVPVVVTPHILVKVLANPHRLNTILDLTIEDAPKNVPAQIQAMVRDHQFEPVSRDLLHVDFVAIDPDQKIKVKVPLNTTGKAVGEATGGQLSRYFREILVECLPADIPVDLSVDVTALEVNMSIRVSDLPENDKIKVTMPDNIKLVAVSTAKIIEEETTEEGEESEETAESTEEKPAAE